MATSQSWLEQMQQMKRQQMNDDGEAESEAKLRKEPESPGEIMHWLMKAAMPEWTPKELKSSKTKLKTVGVECCSDLEDALEEKELNQRLRDKNMKTFGVSTLARFRSQIKTHRERQRMQFLLEERRRLDIERKANAELPASSTQSTADGQEETESLSTEDDLGALGTAGSVEEDGIQEDPSGPLEDDVRDVHDAAHECVVEDSLAESAASCLLPDSAEDTTLEDEAVEQEAKDVEETPLENSDESESNGDDHSAGGDGSDDEEEF